MKKCAYRKRPRKRSGDGSTLDTIGNLGLAGGIVPGPIGWISMGVGAAAKITGKILKNRDQKKKANQAQTAQDDLIARQEYSGDLASLEQYNNMFNTDSLTATAAGGIQLPGGHGEIVKGGGLNPISDGVALFTGRDHAEEGIWLDTDGTGSADLEVEDGEALAQDMVFSKRRKIHSIGVEYLEEEGFKGFSGKTYAETIEKLGKLQEKYQDKYEGRDLIAMNTADIMLERIDQAIQTVFAVQEGTKRKQ